MICKRCGYCCTYIELAFKGMSPGDDFSTWLAHHDLNMGERDGETTMRLETPCRHLRYDEDRVASCAIYENRPEICRDDRIKCPREVRQC